MSYSPVAISPDMYLRAWDRVSRAFGNVARDRGVVPVSHCGAWTSVDLVTHLGQVYAMVDDVIVHRATEPRRLDVETPSGSDSFDALIDWFDERRQTLWNTLSTTEPDLAVWTWGPPSTVMFYLRRMTHETAVHLDDLHPGLDLARLDIERAIVCDGIDEYFEVVLPRSLARSKADTPGGSLHLHCIDGEGEWLVTTNDRSVVMSHEHAKASVAWRGPAIDLFLSCWGRKRAGVDILGEPEISDQWAALAP